MLSAQSTSFFRRFLAIFAIGLAFLAGCSSFQFNMNQNGKDANDANAAPVPTLPGKYLVRVAPYVFLSDFEIQKDLPLFQELGHLRDQVYQDLKLPDSTTMIQVYLFEDRDKYERFMQSRYPKLPSRRAFFVAQSRGVGRSEDLLIYTYWGDRVRQDLRHELTHALLHSVLKDVPLWLDEGLAEYYELPLEQKGINRAHVEQLRKELSLDFKPDLIRLELMDEVGKMNRAEYRESWAWVHFLLNFSPDTRKNLLTYLQQLRDTSNPGNFREKLLEILPTPETDLQNHILRLDFAPVEKKPSSP
ncbi:MAG: DUF1570 domain-containing protein [Gemmataceae bacterium]|nr:DUF1570 domain-containing protein [Gemmataceae bacterium]